MAQGAYRIWTTDEIGNLLGNPTPPQGQPPESPEPTDDKATDIYFGVVGNAPSPFPKDQIDLQQNIAKVLRTVQLLYLKPDEDSEKPHKQGSVARCKAQFRSYYVRLFYLAQLGLEGASASPEVAQIDLTTITADLVADEAGRIKNGHLKRLAQVAATMSALPIAVYILMCLIPSKSMLDDFLGLIGIQPPVLANFMLLWVGCFIGVWLSYGIRTTNFTLADLTQTDIDYLQPVTRMLFAGALTMILGIMFMLGAVEISVGSYSITKISTDPRLAFMIGAFCGISELMLPAAVNKQASDFVNKIK